MGYQLNADALNTVFAKWSDTYDIYAPKLFAGTGRSSMQDIVRYGKITKPEEIVWDKRSDYSAKDVLLPVCQTLFYFNENTVTEAEAPEKGAIILLRSCDLHAIKRFDYMYLQNGPEDYYYKRVRDRVKFVLMGCSQEFENCFCVSMGTNTSDNYDVALNFKDGQYFLDAIGLIVVCAFTPQAAFGGAVGTSIMIALQLGCARGLFSNESGLGSSPLVASSAITRNPARQALVSMTGTFWDTVVVCALTGIALVSSILASPEIAASFNDGSFLGATATLVTACFSQIPVVGPPSCFVSVWFSSRIQTMVGWSYYGNRCITYLFGKHAIRPYQIVIFGDLLLGRDRPAGLRLGYL